MAENEKVGGLEVDFIANTTEFEAAITRAGTKLAEFTKQMGAKGAQQAAKNIRELESVKAQVEVTGNINSIKIKSDVETALKAVFDKKWTVQVDLGHLTQNLEAFFQGHKFDINVGGVAGTLQGNVSGVPQHQAATHMQQVDTQTAQVTRELRKTVANAMKLNKDTGDAITFAHQALTEAFESVGQSFGSVKSESDDAAAKVLDIFKVIGTQTEQMARYGAPNPKLGGYRELESGTMSPSSLMARFGFDPTHAGAVSRTLSAFAGAPEGEESKGFHRIIRMLEPVRQILGNQPISEAPVAQRTTAAPVAAHVAQQQAEAITKTAAVLERLGGSTGIAAAIAQAKTTAQAGFSFASFDRNILRDSTVRPPERSRRVNSDDIEADKTVLHDLGLSTSNRSGHSTGGVGGRGGRQRGRVVGSGGFTGDLEPLLRAAEQGIFENVFEDEKSKELFRINVNPDDEEGVAALKELKRPGQGLRTIAGRGTRARPIRAREAMIRKAIADLGIEEDDASRQAIMEEFERPEFAAALRQGARVGGMTGSNGGSSRSRNSQGRPTGMGLGAEAARLFEARDAAVEEVNNIGDTMAGLAGDIERMAGSGQDTSGLEAQHRDLAKAYDKARRRVMSVSRDLTRLYGPSNGPVLREAGIQSNLENQARLEAGRTPEADIQGWLASPEGRGALTHAMIDNEELPHPEAIINALEQRIGELGELGAGSRRPTPGKGAVQTSGLITGSGAIHDIGADLIEELMEGMQDATPDAKKLARTYFEDIVYGRTGVESNARRLAETEAQSRDRLGSIRPGTVADMKHGLTGEGQYRYALGTGGARAVDIENQRAKIAKLEQQLASAGTRPRRRAGESDAAFEARKNEPDRLRRELSLARYGGYDEEGKPVRGLAQMEAAESMSSSRQALEYATARRARQTNLHTRGQQVPPSGDATREMSNDLGVTNLGEGPGSRFGRFNAIYGNAVRMREDSSGQGPWHGGAGGNAGGGGGGYGSAGYREVSGPIHVIVDNVPLRVAWEGGGGGAGGGGRGGGRGGGSGAGGGSGEPEESRSLNVNGVARKQIRYLRTPGLTAEDRARYRFADQRESQRMAAKPSNAEGNFIDALFSANGIQSTAQKQAARERAAQLRRDRQALRTSDPEELSGQRDSASDEFEGLRAQNRRAQRFVPRRGFGASLTDLVTAGLGGKSFTRQLEAADRAQQELTEITQSGEKRAQLRTQLQGLSRAIQAEGPNTDRGKALIDQYKEVTAQIRGHTKAIEISTKKFQENSDYVTKSSTVLKSFAAAGVGGAVSAAAGSFQFAIASVITGPLLQGIGEALNAGIERALGSPADVATTRTGLAAGVQQAGGRADVAFAQQAAAIGLSNQNAELFGPEVSRSATLTAGNLNIVQQANLLKTLNSIGREGGANAAWGSTLNGLFGTALNGTPSISETLGDRIGDIGDPSVRGVLNPVVGVRNPVTGVRNPVTGVQTDTFRTSQANIDMINGVLDKVADNLVKFDNAVGVSEESLRKQADELKASGASDSLSKKVAQGGGAFFNKETGELATGKEISTSFIEALEAATKPTIEQLLKAADPQIQARSSLRMLQREFLTSTQIPAEAGLAEAAQPILDANVGINTTGLSPADVKAVNKELASTQTIIDGLRADAAEGISKATSLVSDRLGAGAAKQFGDALSNVQDIGEQIAGIQIGIQTKQAAYSAAQYSYQIAVAKRSLEDAKGLTGQIGASNKDNLGVIERQTFMLQRQSQQLSMQLSQRQINFQRAQANFQSPGQTSEERAARQEEAKVEADYAQKQLNIQKQLFGLQGRSFQITATRQVRDLVRQLGLLEKGRALNVETAVAEKKIANLTRVQEKENKKVQAFYSQAVEATGEIMGLTTDLVAQTGENLNKVAAAVLKSYRTVILGMTESLSMGGRSQVQTGQPGSSDPKEGYASGVLATTSGPTDITIGEAGKETVAVLRNPRRMLSGGSGGGGGGIVININNPSVRNDGDITKIAVEVEKVLNRRGAQIGMRSLR